MERSQVITHIPFPLHGREQKESLLPRALRRGPALCFASLDYTVKHCYIYLSKNGNI